MLDDVYGDTGEDDAEHKEEAHELIVGQEIER
jgi:hypothetical protein